MIHFNYFKFLQCGFFSKQIDNMNDFTVVEFNVNRNSEQCEPKQLVCYAL